MATVPLGKKPGLNRFIGSCRSKGVHAGPVTSIPGSRYFLRCLDPPNPPQTPSQKVLGALGIDHWPHTKQLVPPRKP